MITDDMVQIPPTLDRVAVKLVLLNAFQRGASDVFFQTNEPIRARIHGEVAKLTRRSLASHEVLRVIDEVYGESGSAAVTAGDPRDYADSFEYERGRSVNWRVNATACALGAMNSGVEVVYRAIPESPPELSSLDVPPEIVEALNPSEGMILVVGPTGSGKSTLLAAITRDSLENGRHRIWRTFEAPVEFVYDKINRHQTNIISQSSVGTGGHVASFAQGVANVLRRTPTDILVGEMRDRETIEAGILAAKTGHRVWSTAHAGNVAETVYRLISAFQGTERALKVVDFLQAIRMIVVQQLLPKVNGGRTPIREYLIFSKEIRDALIDVPVEHVHREIDQRVRSSSHSFKDDAARMLRAGLITDDVAKPYLRG